MKSLRPHVRRIAAFFIIQIVISVVYPTVSWALTSGPATPEATSFEPVDTTDMVNTLTGDLAYNIPLLEVPGPAGGYPLSLSYHGGIMTEEEASWVGLGWTLNPGAINRSVNGWADDHKDVDVTNRFYWEGGERKQLDVGVTVPLGGPVSVSGGISLGRDTYQGFGVGGYVGVGYTFAKLGKNGSLGAGATLGVDPWGSPYASVGLNAGTPLSEGSSMRLSGGVGLSTNFKSISGFASGGVSVSYENDEKNNKPHLSAGGASLVGSSISTSGGGIRLSVGGGIGSVQNSKSGKISTRSTGFSLPIPFLNISYNYTRYWIDQSDIIGTNGALHYPVVDPNDPEFYYSQSYDTYHLYDPALEGGIVENEDPTKLAGGSFPDVDSYNISAQGVNGQMRPYLYKRFLHRQTRREKNSENDWIRKVINNPLGYDSSRVQFRMSGEFSNRHLYDDDGLVAKNNSERSLSYSFDQQSQTGTTDEPGFNGRHLAGSNHIEYWTNKEIKDYSTHLQTNNTPSKAVQRAVRFGLIENNAAGFSRGGDDQIGGFVVTNSSGVRYHFALPAYASGEYQYSTNIKKTNGHTGSTTSKPTKYAYTWFLTAITGPDFVDRGTEGKLDAEDWGYWVSFDYGLWATNFSWRNPFEGYKPDIDRTFNSYSRGVKELYYLNAIRTASHTALFVKDIRQDGKDTRSFVNWWPSSSIQNCYEFNGEQTCEEVIQEVTFMQVPTATLKLKEILLFKNSDITEIFSTNNSINSISQIGPNDVSTYVDTGSGTFGQTFTSVLYDKSKIIDPADFAGFQQSINSNILRRIDFSTDYSLRQGAPNSYVMTASTQTPQQKTGTLTLKELKFYGHGAASLPAMKFDYEDESPTTAAILRNEIGGTTIVELFVDEHHSLGQILKINSGYYIVYEVLDPGAEYRIKHIEGSVVSIPNNQDVSINYKLTKNPPYNKDKYDSWGFYKSDFDAVLTAKNENLGRQTSPVSARSLDVWSLRKVKTNLGAEINIEYEPDSYSNVVLELKKPFMIIDSFNPNDTNNTIELEVSYPFDETEMSIASYFLNKQIKIDAIVSWKYDVNNDNDFKVKTFDAQVIDVDGNVLTINSPDMLDYYNSTGVLQTKPGTFEVEGNIYMPEAPSGTYTAYGGGIRCSAVKLTNPISGITNVTSYEIIDETTGKTSGATPYTPDGMDLYAIDYINDNGNINLDITQPKGIEALEKFKKKLYNKFEDLLSNARELPPPGIMYSQVTVREKMELHDGTSREQPTYSSYYFQTFYKEVVDIEQPQEGESGYDMYPFQGVPTIEPGDFAIKQAIRRNVTLKNRTGEIGTLKRVVLRTDKGKISETLNHYLHESANYEDSLATKFGNQGRIEEQFVDSRIVRMKSDMTVNVPNWGQGTTRAHEILGVVSKRIELPVVNLGTSTVNYKTGITTTTRNLAFDFFSGEVTTTYSEDGYGNKYVSHAVPAYRLKNGVGVNDIAYPGMGLAMNGGKNMLTQEGASYSYMVASDFNPDVHDYKTKIVGVVGASVQTWSDDNDVLDGYSAVTNYPTGIYRKKATYSFIGDNSPTVAGGLFNPASFSEATLEQDNTIVATTWQKNAEITLYDVNSHALEATDINGNYAATRLDAKNERVISTVANARFGEFTASGFESTNEGDVLVSGTLSDGVGTPLTKSHSGGKMVKTTGAQTACSYTGSSHSSRKYKVSFWSSSPTVQVVLAGNHTPKVVGTYGSWYLMESLVDVSAGNFTAQVKSLATGTTDVYFDDFRVHPVDATMTSYVYNTWGELSDILDANNLFTHYEYDGMGRLKSVKRETLKYGPVKTSEITITYANQN